MKDEPFLAWLFTIFENADDGNARYYHGNNSKQESKGIDIRPLIMHGKGVKEIGGHIQPCQVVNSFLSTKE
jgi:hypothetical protein